ncbi:thioredoxin family protein [Phenylobacterium immobile]|uniref:thioredoxin family protein n=1 Tax=Phenylobacterium immobile TaxID=21 RepID=UPI000AE42FAB|nr:co-chaperone YbbN [Phenylobacterium immobile]
MSLIGETKPADDLIKEGTDAGFMADVIEASKTQPVIVDFWAPWCGPCRQLGPSIEKHVLAAKGKVKLVKIDIDKHPAYAGQMRVQSIPAVFAFAGGKPVDGFMGALPDSQVKDFVDRVGALGGDPEAESLDAILALAAESLELGDLGGAAQAYAEVLQADPENVKALGGLARVYLAGGDAERAGEIAAMAPADAKNADLDSVRAALALAAEAPSETAEFEQRLAKDEGDHEARFELAKALAGTGRLDEAVDQLITIIERDRAWNDEAARKQLLTVFEAAGLMSETAKRGRRRLSAALFA